MNKILKLYTDKPDAETENEREDILKIKNTPSLFTEEIKEYDFKSKISMSKVEDSKQFSEINLHASRDDNKSYGVSSEDSIRLSTIKNMLKNRRKYQAL